MVISIRELFETHGFGKKTSSINENNPLLLNRPKPDEVKKKLGT